MKRIAFIAFQAALFAPSAFAVEPLVTKTNWSGYTLPEWVRNERCEVFTDKVVVTSFFGATEELSFTLTETSPIELSEGIRNVVLTAASESVESVDNNLCDAPSTEISAQSLNGGEALVLFSSGGCASPRLERKGHASRMLVDLVNRYCPRTSDFGADRD